MSSATIGKCLCGKVTVSVDTQVFEAANNAGLCYCTNCRRAGGCLATYVLVSPQSAVKITGEPKIYHDSDTDSGNTIQRAFCGDCGSPIYSASLKMPDLRFVKLGLFDTNPKPVMEIYCQSRPSWIIAIEGAQQFDKAPMN